MKRLKIENAELSRALRSNTRNAFTIVELLVVIVVIAILAAITVVSYVNITTRAENLKTINSVAEYVKVIEAYASQNGNYPIASYSCLGPSGTACASINNSAVCFGEGGATTNSSFITALSTVANTIPSPSTQTMNCGGVPYGGAWYNSSDGKSAIMQYHLKGNQQCSPVGVSIRLRNQQEDVTFCSIALPNL